MLTTKPIEQNPMCCFFYILLIRKTTEPEVQNYCFFILLKQKNNRLFFNLLVLWKQARIGTKNRRLNGLFTKSLNVLNTYSKSYPWNLSRVHTIEGRDCMECLTWSVPSRLIFKQTTWSVPSRLNFKQTTWSDYTYHEISCPCHQSSTYPCNLHSLSRLNCLFPRLHDNWQEIG